MNRTLLALGVVTTLGLLGACSPPQGSPPPATSSAPSTANGGGKAPTVRHPLNASAFVGKPCSALTDADLSALGFPGATQTNNSDKSGAGCGWSVGTNGVGVSWETVDTDGLNSLYRLKSQQAYWIPLTISGYPAVEADSDDAREQNGSCVVNVGINDQLFFFADGELNAGQGQQSCELAKRTAAAVIKNLQSAQGG